MGMFVAPLLFSGGSYFRLLPLADVFPVLCETAWLWGA
jgi:hypothetical protein